MHNFKKLKIWNESMDLVSESYKITRSFPKFETYGLISQMNRCAVSIPSNIAEGEDLKSDAQAMRHFYYSRGSLAELNTQIIICQKIGYLDQNESNKLLSECEEISKMLNALIKYRTKSK